MATALTPGLKVLELVTQATHGVSGLAGVMDEMTPLQREAVTAFVLGLHRASAALALDGWPSLSAQPTPCPNCDAPDHF